MRLIDIEDVALLKTVTDGGLSAKKLWRRINNQPTVDAVPVIRCKDCRFLREQYLCINGNNFPAHWCKQWAGIVPESGFCHLAERKEE